MKKIILSVLMILSVTFIFAKPNEDVVENTNEEVELMIQNFMENGSYILFYDMNEKGVISSKEYRAKRFVYSIGFYKKGIWIYFEGSKDRTNYSYDDVLIQQDEHGNLIIID